MILFIVLLFVVILILREEKEDTECNKIVSYLSEHPPKFIKWWDELDNKTKDDKFNIVTEVKYYKDHIK